MRLFHALSIQTKKLADYYHTSKTDITTAITLTLLLWGHSAGTTHTFSAQSPDWGFCHFLSREDTA